MSELATLLSEALDLCARARKLDEPLETIEAGHPRNPLDHPVTKCATPVLWVAEQYDKDLADWENRAKSALAKEHKL